MPRRDLLAPIDVDVPDHDLGTLGNQQLGRRPTDTPGTPGHDRHLAGKLLCLHGAIVRCRTFRGGGTGRSATDARLCSDAVEGVGIGGEKIALRDLGSRRLVPFLQRRWHASDTGWRSSRQRRGPSFQRCHRAPGPKRSRCPPLAFAGTDDDPGWPTPDNVATGAATSGDRMPPSVFPLLSVRKACRLAWSTSRRGDWRGGFPDVSQWLTSERGRSQFVGV